MLLLVTFTLLRPGFWLDLVSPRYECRPGSALVAQAQAAPPGAGLRVLIEGTTLEGKDVKKTVLLPLADKGTPLQRIAGAGLQVMVLPDGPQVMGVGLNSPADKAGFEQGFRVRGVEVERDRLDKEWLFVPALLLLGGVMWVQRRRAAVTPAPVAVRATPG